MKDNKLWAEALSQISDGHLDEAAEPQRKQRFSWAGILAGALAAAMLAMILLPTGFLFLIFQGAGGAEPTTGHPGTTATKDPTEHLDGIPPELVSLAASPRNQSALDKAAVSQKTRLSTPSRYDFFLESSRLLLSGTGENALWSPVNAWLNLAMTARLTAGTSRQEILDALGATDLDTLTAQASALWEATYMDEAAGTCLLANSVWIDTLCDFERGAMDALAYELYASVFRADFDAPQTGDMIRSWINEHTGGLLTDAVRSLDVPEDAFIALFSTICFRGRWTDEFHPEHSAPGVFRTPGGVVSCTFMKKDAYSTRYCWGSNFSAVGLSMRNGAQMWFILPDEGISVDRILADESYLILAASDFDSVTGSYSWTDSRNAKVNLSIPKFDISGQIEQDAMLQALGITQAFDPDTADFSQALPGSHAYLQNISQAVRVTVDEEGLTAAAFTANIPGSAPPPEEIIDFVLDRPFLFVIEKAGVPLFVGTVNDPTA